MQRRTFLKAGSAVAAAALGSPFKIGPLAIGEAAAQSRNETLLVVAEAGPPNLDAQAAALNRATFGLSWNVYDRLIGFGIKDIGNGLSSFDFNALKPELAESFQEASDGMSVTFKMRPDAKFHDGRPVTARDAKWSYDRAVSVGGSPTVQMAASSLTKAEQFVVVDERTFRVDYVKRDKLVLPNLAVISGMILNSELCKQHATAADPWAKEWVGANDAGGGAFRIESYKPGQEVIYARFDDWKGGPLPKLRRVIFRIVPQAGNRRALIERGDADLSFDLPPKDFNELIAAGKLKVQGVPATNSVNFIGMNTTMEPFNKTKVRQAIAFALPYQSIQEAVIFGRGRPLSGGGEATPSSTAWPTPLPYKTDYAKAKALLAEAGYPDGFETKFSFDLGEATIGEPLAVFIQQSLAQIGVKVTIDKLPAGQLAGRLAKKELAFYFGAFGAWFDTPDYYFYLQYHQQNGPGNSAGFINPYLSEQVDIARFERDPAKFEAAIKNVIKVAFDEVPYVPLYQPYLDVAMQPNISGYAYMFHRQIDFRTLSKG
jgi:peptide/nickel transport system substrate-binding protein